MDDQACPKCKTTLYRNPNMKLLVNVCGHNLCESCVDLLFLKGQQSAHENLKIKTSLLTS
jgi:CDK-activating kinase assembly factor MAT1